MTREEIVGRYAQFMWDNRWPSDTELQCMVEAVGTDPQILHDAIALATAGMTPGEKEIFIRIAKLRLIALP